MKKEKKIFLIIILISFVIASFILVSAIDYNFSIPTGVGTASENSTYFGRLIQGALSDKDAKIFVWLITTIALYLILSSALDSAGLAFFVSIPTAFILTTFITPGPVVGIIRSYDVLPVVFTTFLPIGILFIITSTAISKGKVSLLNSSWLLWCIYFIYISMKIIAFVGLQDPSKLAELGWFATMLSKIPLWLSYIFPKSALEFFQVAPSTDADLVYFWFSISISFIISFCMVFFSGFFMNQIARRILSIEKAQWEKEIDQSALGLKTLSNVGKQEAGSKPT